MLIVLAGAALCFLAGGVMAADYYVAPAGPGGGGTNWATAFSNAQDAATLATNAGDKIYLQWGIYSNASQIVISNALGLTVVGGCVGSGTNTYSGTNSTLTKTGGVMRIVYGCDSTVTMACVTVSGGLFTAGANNGAGLFFTNCAVTLTNCVVRDNINTNTSSTSDGLGGGLCCAGGSLGVYNCVFSNNYMYQSGRAPGGGGIAGTNTPMTIAGSVFVNNSGAVGGNYGLNGGGVCSIGPGLVTITNCDFRGNWAEGAGARYGYGGGVYLCGGSAVIACSAFSSNYAGCGAGYGVGGALFLTGLQSVLVRSNIFTDNYIDGGNSAAAGTFYIGNCSTTIIDECVIESRNKTAYAEHVYFDGSSNTWLRNTIVRSNTYSRGIYFAGAACRLVMSNCMVLKNKSDGLMVAGGTATVAHCTFANNMDNGLQCSGAGVLALTNCLVALNVDDGLLISAGTAVVANCTLADNIGWGVNRTGGTGAVINSIAWGNAAGGVASNASLGVTYSCSQDSPYGAGTGNIVTNPLFAPVPGYYYLSETNLADQTNHSPCIDAGLGNASDYGLDSRTTRTDGTNDSGVVDLGYHYTNGVAVPHLVPVCYVDGVGGDNGNSGLTWTSAWKSVTYAMTNVAGDGTINLATGVYSAATTLESFPLAVQLANLTLAASNSNPALTVLDNAGVGGRRLFQAWCKGSILLKGMTFRGGYFATGENHGGGLYFLGCTVTLTNCVVRDNTNLNSSSTSDGLGGGLCCAGGSLAVYNCVFSNNYMYQTGRAPGGGGIAGTNTPMTIAGSVFVNNSGAVGGNYGLNGGGVCSIGPGLVTISNCDFRGNWAEGAGARSGYGGGVYLCGGSAAIACSAFSSNYAGCGGGYGVGGALFLTSLQSIVVRSNYFIDNFIYGGASVGGAIYIANSVTSVLDECVIESRNKTAYAEHVCFDGSSNTWIQNTMVRSNTSSRGVYFAGSACRLAVSNCQVVKNAGDGLLVAGGTATVAHCAFANNMGNGLQWSGAGALGMTNCLLALNASDGLRLAAGTAVVANCTLAENGGWGCNLSGGTGTVINSIAWGNAAGGLVSNASLGVTYSCSQNAPYGAGTGNIVTNPLFAPVPGYYYLSETNLADQTNHSPCIDAGLGNASDYGLDSRTTRTDGTNDSGVVDLGYHYTNGVAVPHLVPVCYVDGVGGDNGNSGLAWTSAWKSVTYAMTNVAADGTINLATGVYSAAATLESFPLAVQLANLTLAASNSNPALTVLDNELVSGRRVFQAWCKGSILLKGLTFRRGFFASGENNGGGLYFLGCAVTLSNCVVRDNINTNTSVTSDGVGGGLYCAGGSLVVYDCVFSNNHMYGYPYPGGAGLGVSNTLLTIAGTVFAGNFGWGGGNYGLSGGGVYSVGSGPVIITNCHFRGNWGSGANARAAYGGGVYLCGGSAVIVNSAFSSNYAGFGGGDGYGGALYLTGLRSAEVRSNYFSDNYIYGAGAALGEGGSAIYVINSATNIVDECVIESRNKTAYAEHMHFSSSSNTWIQNTIVRSNTSSRGIYFAGAACRLAMSNCMVLKNKSDGLMVAGGTATVAFCVLANNGGAGLFVSAGTAALVNCTLANNVGWGIARPTSAGLTVKNSILWGNNLGGIGHNQNLTLTFTDSQDAWAAGLGVGNFSADPLFVDAAGGDYHEMGVEGSYHGGGWTPDARNSPCLDAGDPASDWSREPKPCGNRINAGAYGNTAEATRSLPKVGTVLRIY